jgi:D-alanyl-D-alanine carboxypeptidase
VFLVPLLALSACAPADAVSPLLQEMLNTKYAAFKTAAKLPDNAGVVLCLESPKGKFTATAGLPAGVNQNAHYRIASVSKTFTAAGIMLLDQQGKLKIDDFVTANMPGTNNPYLPASPSYAIPYKDQITIRQLLSHRAGVFDVFNSIVPPTSRYPYAGKNYRIFMHADFGEPDHQFSSDELAGVIAVDQLSTGAPGKEYRYSDTGYTLLAKILQRVSGKSYDRFLADNFFVPLGLAQTSAPWSAYDTGLPSPFMTGYANGGAGFIPFVEDNMSDQVGPGNIVSTPADMAHWMRALLSGRGPLTKEQVARMMEVPAGNTTYALGLGNSPVGIGHSGAHPGYVNLVVYYPEGDVSVVVATPFIDYNGLGPHLAFLNEVGIEARTLAGYPGPWPK